MDINRLFQVGQIVDSCLTTETLEKLYPSARMGFVFLEENELGARKKLFIDLLELSGEAVGKELGRELWSDEVILVYNRVRQFMIARGLD